MSSRRIFVQLPVQSPDGTVIRRQYCDCMPIVFICQDERHATEVVSTVSSAFESWNIPGIEEEWTDEQLLKLNNHPILNGVRRKLYVFLRPETGQKTITTDYQHDIFPLLGNHQTSYIPLRRVETLAHALVFIMTKGDTLKLRRLGLEWAERRSSPRLEAKRKPDVGDPSNPLQFNSASASVPASAGGRSELASGRKAPCCTKCREPMKGHSKSRCQKLVNASLEAAIGELSLNEGRGQAAATIDLPLPANPTSYGEAHCFILSSEDIERVDATIAAQGLKSRTVNLTEAQSGEVAYIVARNSGTLEALAADVAKMSVRVNVSWLRVSSAAAIGAITAWTGLAYL